MNSTIKQFFPCHMIKANSCCTNLFFKDELIGTHMIQTSIIDGAKINSKVHCFPFISNCKRVFLLFLLAQKHIDKTFISQTMRKYFITVGKPPLSATSIVFDKKYHKCCFTKTNQLRITTLFSMNCSKKNNHLTKRWFCDTYAFHN